MPSSVATTIVASAASGAVWQTWAGTLSQALTDVGLAKHTTAGAAASISSVSKPGTAGTLGGFEIRKLAAPASGGTDVYIRFEYGTGSTASQPGLKIGVSSGPPLQDGTGALTGTGSTVAALSVLTSGDATSRPLYVSYDGHGFAIAHTIDSTTSTSKFFLAVDRQRTPSGAGGANSGWPNNGFARFHAAASTQSFLSVDPTADTTSTLTRFPALTGRTLSSSASMVNQSGDMTVFPMLIPSRQGTYNSMMAMAYPYIDANINTTLSINHLGQARPYRALAGSFTNTDALGNAGVGLLMWWG